MARNWLSNVGLMAGCRARLCATFIEISSRAAPARVFFSPARVASRGLPVVATYRVQVHEPGLDQSQPDLQSKGQREARYVPLIVQYRRLPSSKRIVNWFRRFETQNYFHLHSRRILPFFCHDDRKTERAPSFKQAPDQSEGHTRARIPPLPQRHAFPPSIKREAIVLSDRLDRCTVGQSSPCLRG